MFAVWRYFSPRELACKTNKFHDYDKFNSS
jgi:hypothetical protein